MAFWVVRAGKHGEQQDAALSQGLVCHAWNDLPDYGGVADKAVLRKVYQASYPTADKKEVDSGLGQVWRFARDMQIGDLVALPLKTESSIMFGRVTGPYQYREVAPNVMHIRNVRWDRKLPRSAFPQDILNSINSALTVFTAAKNDAEKRVLAILSGVTEAVAVTEPSIDNEEGPDEAEETNLVDTARDEITKFIEANFRGHDFAYLISEILKAQGYGTKVSPSGPDGGVDILAGTGALGFDRPRLCVQVKSGKSAEGQATYNGLLGVVSKFGSEQGLLVSWGGFTQAVINDARKEFFKIRLWDQGDVVQAILDCYEKLDDEIKAELPLKRIWVLVKEQPG